MDVNHIDKQKLIDKRLKINKKSLQKIQTIISGKLINNKISRKSKTE